MTRKKLCCVIPVGPNQVDNANLFASITRGESYESEFILVLDGTSTSVLKELQEFSSRHSNVKLIYSSARNPGGSRNLGMIEADSDWLVFFDADDSFNSIEILKGLEETTDEPEAIIFGFTIDGKSTGESIIHRAQSRNNSKERLRNSLIHYPGIWRWAFRADSLSASKFLELKMGEDIVFLINFLKIERRIEYSSRVVYNYNCSLPTQLTKSLSAKQDLLLAFKAAVDVISTSNVKNENKALIGLTSLLLYSALRHLRLTNRLLLVGSVISNGIKSWSNFKLLISLVIERPRAKYGKKQ